MTYDHLFHFPQVPKTTRTGALLSIRSLKKNTDLAEFGRKTNSVNKIRCNRVYISLYFGADPSLRSYTVKCPSKLVHFIKILFFFSPFLTCLTNAARQ